MEFKDEITKKIGKKNYQILMDSIKDGKTKKQQVQDIALLMGGPVHGVFQAKISEPDVKLYDVMRAMMDEWFLLKVHQENFEGITELRAILEDYNVNLKYLADKMRTDVAMPTSGLSSTYPDKLRKNEPETR